MTKRRKHCCAHRPVPRNRNWRLPWKPRLMIAPLYILRSFILPEAHHCTFTLSLTHTHTHQASCEWIIEEILIKQHGSSVPRYLANTARASTLSLHVKSFQSEPAGPPDCTHKLVKICSKRN